MPAIQAIAGALPRPPGFPGGPPMPFGLPSLPAPPGSPGPVASYINAIAANNPGIVGTTSHGAGPSGGPGPSVANISGVLSNNQPPGGWAPPAGASAFPAAAAAGASLAAQTAAQAGYNPQKPEQPAPAKFVGQPEQPAAAAGSAAKMGYNDAKAKYGRSRAMEMQASGEVGD